MSRKSTISANTWFKRLIVAACRILSHQFREFFNTFSLLSLKLFQSYLYSLISLRFALPFSFQLIGLLE